MKYGLTTYTAPTVEPLSTTEAKTHARIEHSADDTYIDTLVKAARIYCETYLNRTLVNTTYDLTLDAFPSSGVIRVPRAPLVSVSSITYTATDGTSTVWSSSEYTADIKSEPGRIYPAYGYSWPSVRSVENAITIRYVAGYGAAGSNVPQTIRHAIGLLVAHWHANRESVVSGQAMPLPMAVESLLMSERIMEAA